MDVDGLKQCRHFGQSFGTAHGGAGSEDLSASAVVLPPEHDPVPASRGFALLKTTALETPAAWRGGRVSPFIPRHGRTIPSETARSESVLNVGSRGYAEQKKSPQLALRGKVGWWRGSKLHDFVESMQEVADGIRAAYQITTSGTSELFFYPYLSGIMAACSCQRS